MIRVRQIKVYYKDNDLKKAIAKKLKVTINDIIKYDIKKQSLDCRNKPDIYYVYEVSVELKNEQQVLRYPSKDISIDKEEKYQKEVSGSIKLEKSPVIIGSGPAGLFCAYMLASYGYKPIVIERGSKVEERVKKIEEFWQNNKLDLNCNVSFGEGGAGTFSDGKLNTLVNDKFYRYQKVMEVFVKFGAPKEILYLNKPHIGTDILRDVIKNMRNEIINLGGEFYFDTCMNDINIEDNQVKSIILSDGRKILCDILVLAIGHSARDTFKVLYDKKFDMESKPFAVGLRIMHSQKMINQNQYGIDSSLLPEASYKLTHQTKEGRGVYTFCMCPGGYVVNASSENNKLCINGMSDYKRDSGISNSAIICTINKEDYGKDVLDGLEFQRKIEANAYKVGNGLIPVSRYVDYKNNKMSSKINDELIKIKGGYNLANLNEILPKNINDALIEGIDAFDKKIKGFASCDAVVCGIEARTSSPIRIIRNDSLESNFNGIYPCGEGAGYAGGITSAAIDGIKVFEKIVEKYYV